MPQKNKTYLPRNQAAFFEWYYMIFVIYINFRNNFTHKSINVLILNVNMKIASYI